MGAARRTTELRYTELIMSEDGDGDDFTPFRPWDRVPDGGGRGGERPSEPRDVPPISLMTRKELGRLGEDLAAEYLESEGYEIFERNYRCPDGEADLVALDPDSGAVVLVEVKTRRAPTVSDGTYPEEAVTAGKRRRYRRIARCFVRDYYPTPDIRFDVVGVVVERDGSASFNHLVGAFDWWAEL